MAEGYYPDYIEAMSTAYNAQLDAAVEKIRVASFEGPKAGSHNEWARRIKEILTALIDGDQHG